MAQGPVEHDVLATKIGGRSGIGVPSLGNHTECRFLRQADAAARKAISTALDVDRSTFGVFIWLQQAADNKRSLPSQPR